MAKQVLKNAQVFVDGVELSDHTKGVAIDTVDSLPFVPRAGDMVEIDGDKKTAVGVDVNADGTLNVTISANVPARSVFDEMIKKIAEAGGKAKKTTVATHFNGSMAQGLWQIMRPSPPPSMSPSANVAAAIRYMAARSGVAFDDVEGSMAELELKARYYAKKNAPNDRVCDDLMTLFDLDAMLRHDRKRLVVDCEIIDGEPHFTHHIVALDPEPHVHGVTPTMVHYDEVSP